MAEHLGIVVQIKADGSARVTADRKGACGGCNTTGGGCHGCLSASGKMISEAANPVGAKVGDLVNLRMASSKLFTGAAILYLLPVLGLMVGAFAGDGFAGTAGISEVIGAIIGAFCGLAIGYAFLSAVDRGQGLRRRWMPTITRVVRSGVGMPVGHGPSEGHVSCCGD